MDIFSGRHFPHEVILRALHRSLPLRPELSRSGEVDDFNGECRHVQCWWADETYIRVGAGGPDPYLVDTLTLAQNGPENARDHNAEEHLHR